MPRRQSRESDRAPSQRQLRVGELIRHAVAEMLTRGEVHDPVIETHLITIPEVRMTADLRLATVYVMPLGGKDADAVVEALNNNKKFLRSEIAHHVNLKFAPDIRFRIDERFDEAERIEKLLRTPAVHRDIARDKDDESEFMSEDSLVDAPAPLGRKQQFRREKHDVHGWVVLDKPIGMTSTHAVSQIKRLFTAKRVGHAGTLDPLASGCLPIALGEATKTVPFIVDGRKTYRFTICFGDERDTDDSDGRSVATSEKRPSADDIRTHLSRFIGTIEQVPPAYSAVKIAGERAYDLARDGETVELKSRPVRIDRLTLMEMPDADHAILEAECGKGTYVRAIARDLGRALGCLGHISALRRLAVGPFGEVALISLEQLAALCHRAAAGEGNLADALLPVETALDDIPALAVNGADAARLQRGQAVLLRGRDAPILRGTTYITASGELIALAEVDRGEIIPKRVFNLNGLVGRGVLKKGH